MVMSVQLFTHSLSHTFTCLFWSIDIFRMVEVVQVPCFSFPRSRPDTIRVALGETVSIHGSARPIRLRSSGRSQPGSDICLRRTWPYSMQLQQPSRYARWVQTTVVVIFHVSLHNCASISLALDGWFADLLHYWRHPLAMLHKERRIVETYLRTVALQIYVDQGCK